MYIHTHLSLSLYIYIYICIYVYVYIYIYRERERRRKRPGQPCFVGPADCNHCNFVGHVLRQTPIAGPPSRPSGGDFDIHLPRHPE